MRMEQSVQRAPSNRQYRMDKKELYFLDGELLSSQKVISVKGTQVLVKEKENNSIERQIS